MTMNSWDALRPKLAPNPQQYKAGPIMLGAAATTAAGTALMGGSLILLFGITGLPSTFADLLKESTWRLILDIVGLYTMWLVISNGNNFFGVYRPTGYSFCFSGAFGFVVVARGEPAIEATTVIQCASTAHRVPDRVPLSSYRSISFWS